MLTLFTITDTFQNNTSSKELFEKKILADRYNKFESFGDSYQTILLRGRGEIAIQIAILNITDKEIIMISTYYKPVKILMILTLILAMTCSLVFISSNIFQLSINKDLKMFLLLHPIVTLIIFIGLRLTLYFRKTELIDDLKKRKLICT